MSSHITLNVVLLNGWPSSHFMDENERIRQVKKLGFVTAHKWQNLNPVQNCLASKVEHCTSLPSILNKEASKPEISFFKKITNQKTNQKKVQDNNFKQF